jgi:hypothetical protein
VQRLPAYILATMLVATVAVADTERHVNATLAPRGDPQAGGRVELTALPHGGTMIVVTATGLEPGTEYLSLYYGNHACDLEPYEEDDVIGHYTANAAGVGTTSRKVGDDLDEIGSVSVRLAQDFTLEACADVEP